MSGGMQATDHRHNLVLGVTPCAIPSSALTIAVSRAGGLGVLDLADGGRSAREALSTVAAVSTGANFGIRVAAGCALTCIDVVDLLGDGADGLEAVVLAADAPWQIDDIPDPYLVLVEVSGKDEALEAERRGADGVIARGSEAAGRIGELTTFVLLQQLLGERRLGVPVWACGGIGPHTAAAAVLGGAAGVVLDTQLALMPEADLPDGVVAALAASDDDSGASRFAERYGSTARAVRAVLDAVQQAAGTGPVVLETAPLAQRLGTRIPVAQGPMTRVSDTPGFAAAVAADGALPFIALALSDARTTRALLEETRRMLAGRPWGVGVLGFAAEDVRSAQLEVIREIQPSHALIAGGRPDQARALEAEGISTFLHVPSPGLLGQFLDAGARKFVFEGSECGGHVGPRSSFSLWEAQLGVLHDHIDAGLDAVQLEVLFAGGIHDARSSAMVSALAGSLAARGASVGILMGTAYLFTEDAVAHGAVGDVFQEQVLQARRTELLETAPGHATRCVTSPFTEAFAASAAELEAEGLERREIWQRLEQLNVGRLRIASKGIRRDGAELVPVVEDEQRELGLFMAGQVSALRHEVTTVARLHEDVTTGAAEVLDAAGKRLRRDLVAVGGAPEPRPLDVAIVGMACEYPGAADLHEFWANILANIDVVTEVPADRWDASRYYAAPGERQTPPRGDWTPSKWGGFLGDMPFDPLRYGIPPSALAAIEPVQLLALQVAEHALADAGFSGDRARAGVVFAGAQGSDLANANTLRMVLPSYIDKLPAGFEEQLPMLSEDSLPGRLGSVVAGRIANRLDLGGINFTVDAACASSLAAVDAACKELASGASDVMLCGGADLHNALEDFLLFASVGALSPSGRCRTFDASADGIALSEGVACVVLKRLADAERDGDRIYAVIKGVGSGSDGKALGLTAPRPEGQRRALDRAYAMAGVSPSAIGLVEAHGTGTVVGDRTELETLTSVFSGAGAAAGSCTLGSVKSQIGHTKCAAGLAGLIKVAMAVHTGVQPPTHGITEANPAWRPDASPFVFRSEPAPWAVPAEQRFAGVSAFGFGGTNFHVVLGGHASSDVNRHALRRWPAELFLFRAADEPAALRQVERLLGVLETTGGVLETTGAPWSLADLAATACRSGQAGSPVQIAVVAENSDKLRQSLRAALGGQLSSGLFRAGEAPQGKIAVLFPGQGSQRTGMLAELLVAFPELRAFARQRPDVLAAMYPPAAFDDGTRGAQRATLTDTRMAQPALGVAGLAVHRVLSRLGIEADCYAGHSYGELVALAAAGAMDAGTLLRLSTARAESILAAAGPDPGGMAAIAATAGEVSATLPDGVVVANHNAPRQVVISGAREPLAEALERLRAMGVAARELPVACAFHSPVVRGAVGRFADALARQRFSAPVRPVWTNRSGELYPSSELDIATELAAQVGAPVLFTQQIEAMYVDGVRTFVEAGPGTVLSGLVGKILGDRPHVTVACDGGIHGLLTAVAQLAVGGADVQPGWLFAGRGARDVSSLPKPARPGWTVSGHVVRTADGHPVSGGLMPARPLEEPLVQANGADREELVSQFIASSREMIAAQRDVLLSYLGAPAPPPAPVHASSVPVHASPVPVREPAAPAPAPVEWEPVLTTVIGVIAQRTGYPEDMIGPELDLEADLSVDSIKRTEIAGELLNKLGLGADGDCAEALAKARTAAAMAAVLDDGGPAEPTTVEPAVELSIAGTLPVAEADPGAAVEAPSRYLLELVDAAVQPAAEPTSLIGANIVVAGGDPKVAEAVAGHLSARGAMPFVVAGMSDLTSVITPLDGLISLHALEPGGEPVLPSAYPMFRATLAVSPRWVLAAAAADHRADGLRGFFRTARREYPRSTVRLLQVDAGSQADAVAEGIVTELFLTDGDPVVDISGGTRRVYEMTSAELGGLATAGAGPAGVGPAEAEAIEIDRSSVVLLIGGARGITARFATALATVSGCRIELAGRTEEPSGPEPAELAAAADLPSLRRAVARSGITDLAEVDRIARQTVARREVATTLRQLRGIDGGVGYHQVDARDPESIKHLVKKVHAEHGRIDGVVYAAGVIHDALIADKDPDSFATVYGTKVDGARALLAELSELPVRPRFVVQFGSVAAALGNAGQADYAAANDTLETLGIRSAASERMLTVHWGPWAPSAGGMVTPELSRNYAERGVALIRPDDGVDALLRELAWGPSGATSVIYTASGW